MPLSRFIWPSNETIKTWNQLLAITSSAPFMQQCWLLWEPGQNGQVLQLCTGSLGLFLGGWGSTLPRHHSAKHDIVRHFGKVIKTWSQLHGLLTPRSGLDRALYGASSDSTEVIYFPCNSWKTKLWSWGILVLYNCRSLWFLLFCAWLVDVCKTNTKDWSV